MKKRRRFKRWFALVILLILVAIVLAPFNSHWIVTRLAPRFPGILFVVETDQPIVALTIDDGPDAETTPVILDVLERNDAHATFFFITERITGKEEILTRAVAAGHELGNHMTREEDSNRLPLPTFRSELDRAGTKLMEFDNVRWFRPGGGWFNDEMVAEARDAGYETALGSVYPLDTRIPSAQFAAWYVSTQVRPGSVIVLHDWDGRGRRTAEALELLLPVLKEKGFEVTTLTELVDSAGQ